MCGVQTSEAPTAAPRSPAGRVVEPVTVRPPVAELTASETARPAAARPAARSEPAAPPAGALGVALSVVGAPDDGPSQNR